MLSFSKLNAAMIAAVVALFLLAPVELSAGTLGFTGAGQTVVVIDSGLVYNHEAFTGRYVGGWDFANNDSDPFDTPGTNASHGTRVTGVLAASSPIHSGVAPGADIVALRVTNDAGRISLGLVEQALRWVEDNINSFENPITTINISVGAEWNSEEPPFWGPLENELQRLNQAGLFVAASAGNNFAKDPVPGLSYPAASPWVAPAMSLDVNGGLSGFSQRSLNAIGARGISLWTTTSDYDGDNNGLADDWVRSSGTSFASPVVAGAAVLIREAMEQAGFVDIDQDLIFQHMINTSDPVYDSITDQTYRSLNLDAALAALSTTTPGDLNADGFVDGIDYAIAREGLGEVYQSSHLATWKSSFGVGKAISDAGDFNGDSLVDSTDYAVWREGLGSTYSSSGFGSWKFNYGRAGGAGSGEVSTIVPEPATALIVLLGLSLVGLARSWRPAAVQLVNRP